MINQEIENHGYLRWVLFFTFLFFMILDRIITLIHFGFVYTDIDQMVMWNGAFDYAKGIFHEPFFYGQAFNYMLEALLAAPLLWMHVPIHIAMPVSTSLISLLPFIVLAILFFKKRLYFWAFLCLAFPVMLPLQYNFLTTISRGFIQSHFFVPILFIPLFNPKSKKNVTILFIASALSFIMNQSSVLIILPIALYVYSFHVKSPSFYFKSLLVIPFFVADYFAKYYYVIHPEKVLHQMVGLELNKQTFLNCIKNSDIFENLFPFFSGGGMAYLFLFILLAIFAFVKSLKWEFLFVFSFLIILFITFAIPKVQELIPNTGIFFTSNRFYLFLPLFLILASYLIFKNINFKRIPVFIILLLCVISFVIKNHNIDAVVQDITSHTIFPVAKNQDLIKRANELKLVVERNNVDLVVHCTHPWNSIFDAYAFNPITQSLSPKKEKTISVMSEGDRRTWLYPNSVHCKQILLSGITVEMALLTPFEYEIIDQNSILIKNNNLPMADLFGKLKLNYGNDNP